MFGNGDYLVADGLKRRGGVRLGFTIKHSLLSSRDLCGGVRRRQTCYDEQTQKSPQRGGLSSMHFHFLILSPFKEIFKILEAVNFLG